VNAIDLAIDGLRPVAACPPLEVESGGLTFVEVLSATRIVGGIADNVIPELVEARLNYRYAPGRSREEAEARLRELVGAGGELEITSNSPPAHVAEDSPLLRRLRETGDLELLPKQAWTPVAEFSGQGLDAVNLGPGATRYAHRRDERVEVAELEKTLDVLRRFATSRTGDV
jgi:succinyl-diaminopimelate desuccinylase